MSEMNRSTLIKSIWPLVGHRTVVRNTKHVALQYKGWVTVQEVANQYTSKPVPSAQSTESRVRGYYALQI